MELRLKIEARADDSGSPSLCFIAEKGGKITSRPYDPNMTVETLFRLFTNSVESKEKGYIAAAEEISPVRSDRRPGDIQKRDIVKCVKVLPRENSTVELKLDREYTVLGVLKAKDFDGNPVRVFELLDPEVGRIQAFQEEVEFLRENIPFVPVNRNFKEAMLTCKCGEENSVVKLPEQEAYTGVCVKCGEELVLDKAIA